MNISKSTDKIIRSLALRFCGDVEAYTEALTLKALSPTTDTQDLIDEFYSVINELAGDTLLTYEQNLDIAVRENDICA